MFLRNQYIRSLFTKDFNFEDKALQLFHYQYNNNALYQQYLDLIKRSPEDIKTASQIPYLPITFFKSHEVKTGAFRPQLTFESSGTTETTPSRHFVRDSNIYKQSFRTTFQQFYGNVKDTVIIGLLPSYLERENSSLVYMVHHLIQESGQKESGFYLNEYQKLAQTLIDLEAQGKKTLLIGVTFGLLDFAEQFQMKLQNTIVMETGGMKGRREEQTREEVQQFLKERLGVSQIHSEYGMTELLSQAYSQGEGIFQTPPWMKITLRDMNDPLTILSTPATSRLQKGLINVIDLANVDSCAFIATDDLGVLYPDGSFEVRGRRDLSDLRGCSLMAV